MVGDAVLGVVEATEKNTFSQSIHVTQCLGGAQPPSKINTGLSWNQM